MKKRGRGRPWKPLSEEMMKVKRCAVYTFSGNPINKGCCKVLRSVEKFRKNCGVCGGVK